jgi:hypothetical protein
MFGGKDIMFSSFFFMFGGSDILFSSFVFMFGGSDIMFSSFVFMFTKPLNIMSLPPKTKKKLLNIMLLRTHKDKTTEHKVATTEHK